MKILFTGGGSGGHFYPIIAIAEEFNKIVRENKLVNVELYYMSPSPYNAGVLFNNNIIYKKNSAGKVRRYFSFMNFIDLFKTGWGIIRSLWDIFLIYPDVVFGKGGYASFPALLSARILRIPVVIHESDSVPGRTNMWASKFAEKIAVSYPDTAKFFNKEKVAYTGHPIRKDLLMPLTSNAHEFLNLEPAIPTILIIGGSLGSQKINEVLMEALPRLVEKYQVIHQTGKNNFDFTTIKYCTPVPAASITALGATTICSGSSVTLSANTGTGLTYQWKKGNANIAGATASTYTATTAGGYKVVITNANGCSKTSNVINVSVIICREEQIEIAPVSVNVSPNPFTDYAVIDCSNITMQTEIVVLDITGRTVSTVIAEPGTGSVEIGQDLPQGNYLLVVNHGSQMQTFRIVKM